MHSLALVCNSLAKLGIKNEVLFDKVRQFVLDKAKQSGYINEEEGTVFVTSAEPYMQRHFLKPADCAQFMTAFARSGFFDSQLFYLLEGCVLQSLDQMDPE